MSLSDHEEALKAVEDAQWDAADEQGHLYENFNTYANVSTDEATETKQILTSPKGVQSGKDAKKVCKNITRLLRDRHSTTRGSRMFQKRRRRSERFAIVAYGTQPAEEKEDEEDKQETSGSEREDSDSIFLISTDDEIPVYDRPGPDNVLERDRSLSSEEQIIHNQHRNLAEDAMNMKGKGAKLFAKRQQRMEKFVIENKPAEDDNSPNQNGNPSPGPVAFVNHAYNPREQSRESYTPVTCNNIHSTGSTDRFNGFASDENIAMERGNDLSIKVAAVSTPKCRKFRPAEKQPWADDGQPARYASADWSSDEESQRKPVHLSYESDYTGAKPQKRNAFRSVKAPTENFNKPLLRPMSVDPQALDLYQPPPSDSGIYNKPARSWKSVKFQPKSQSKPRETPDKSPNVPYPCTWSKTMSSTPVIISMPPTQTKLLTTSTWKPPTKAQVAQMTKSVSSSNQSHKKQDVRAPSPSVALLQTPIGCRSPSPCLREPVSRDPSPSVRGTQNGTTTLPPRSTLSPPPRYPPQFNCTSPSAPPPSKSQDGDDKKPKVAACIKLLDPSKGAYQPKMEIVYKSSPSLGAILDEEQNTNLKDRPPSRGSFTPQFNKPIAAANSVPHVSYLQKSNNSRPNAPEQKPQALGSIAGGMKGKGAKMFEKQQKRMDRYTKECNGSKEAKIVLPQVQYTANGSNRQVAPDKADRKKMNDVMGEFRKISDSDSPRRPSANRKGKSKDPFHYQQHYIVRRPPSSADFVNADDVASDSNNSATSSLTSSYDLGSTSSSGRVLDQPVQDDVFKSQEISSPKGPPPTVAPKPDLRRFLSNESNENTVTSFVGKDDQLTQESEQSETSNQDQTVHQNHPNTQPEPTVEPKPSQPAVNTRSYAVWSPQRNPIPSTDVTAHLPPPPSYNEVTSQKVTSFKPLFQANLAPYSVYNPTSPAAESNIQKVEESRFAPPPPIRRMFQPAPKPKFVSNATVTKWTPGTN